MSNKYRFFTLSRSTTEDLKNTGRFLEIQKYLESADLIFHTEFICNVEAARQSESINNNQKLLCLKENQQ